MEGGGCAVDGIDVSERMPSVGAGAGYLFWYDVLHDYFG